MCIGCCCCWNVSVAVLCFLDLFSIFSRMLARFSFVIKHSLVDGWEGFGGRKPFQD